MPMSLSREVENVKTSYNAKGLHADCFHVQFVSIVFYVDILSPRHRFQTLCRA